ncbi:MXAN_6230/SCO0854 family RING domain-containing protein [Thermobispora bispora]|uniref:RING-type domain-containing protein n=1 Tax=Thermobispora bispora (strain ATCC 19993 / DSM 43833 / CBS 139.67 / JCM 10125 / KCTC 9307 / NBRC 14880 / R51) TaxID=469371 RepID=D6YAS6_THEBD|nr:MXAN_6230/SCO0854 family RING domain-containing protein [Thermobispora bispora]ADG88293.1 hypothetical protein Tbis_1579 [Thermobispora bispora DSM 43833]
MEQVAQMLLRERLVSPELLAFCPALEPAGPSQEARAVPHPSTADGVLALEADLLRLGYVLSAPLRNRLCELSPADLAHVGRALIHGLLARVGGHVEHVPLFRGFPDTVPADTLEFYVRRVFTVLLQRPEQPCVLCGKVATVRPVSPCAHLVCRACWDGSDFSACPICHGRIDPADPFLKPAGAGSAEAASGTVRVPDRFTLLGLCDDPDAWARDTLTALLSRRGAPRAEDRTAITTLIGCFWPRSAEWLPDRIPARESRAIALAAVVQRGWFEPLARHIDSATDALRLLWTLMGGDPGLRGRPPRRTGIPRPIRRAILAALDRLSLPYLVEDLLRYGEAWKRMAEVLHPHEFHRRYPDAALAFAVVRGTPLERGTPMADALLARAAAYPEVLYLKGGRLRARTFAGRVEAVLRSDPAQALALLARRPGELLRRTADLARRVPAAALADAVRAAAPRVSPAVLIATLGRMRTPPGGTRMFLPRGGAARLWVEPDTRAALPGAAVAAVSVALAEELLRRASALAPVERALIDEELADLLAPIAERSAATSLVRLPRGSVRRIPHGNRIRLFLHWVQPEGVQVDLDLSVALFDDRWRFIGLCDYTNLRLARSAAVHSGDLTSAPGPLGASEFVDLDVPALRTIGGRYAVPVVFSYTGVPFDLLDRGFAGFMETPKGLFDPLAVRQRFDLTGSAKIYVPFVADVRSRTLRWADLTVTAFGRFHNVARHGERLARIASAVEEAFGRGAHVTLWEVARWHAAARAKEVVVRHRDGTATRYVRGPHEDAAAFAVRIGNRSGGEDVRSLDEGDCVADFAALLRDDAPVADGAEVYALHPERLDPAKVRFLDALDLVSRLAPAGASVASA